MSRYRTSNDPVMNQRSIFDAETNSWIPEDEANIDYQAFLAWVDEGNTPEPYVAPEASDEAQG